MYDANVCPTAFREESNNCSKRGNFRNVFPFTRAKYASIITGVVTFFTTTKFYKTKEVT